MLTQIVTGNGFTDNAQRFDDYGSSYQSGHDNWLQSQGEYLSLTSGISISLKYRSNGFFYLGWNDNSNAFNYPTKAIILPPSATVNTVSYYISGGTHQGNLTFTAVYYYSSTSGTPNSIPTTNPTTKVFVLNTTGFTQGYMINSGMTAKFTNEYGSSMDLNITGWNSVTKSLTGTSYHFNGTDSGTTWNVDIFPFVNYVQNTITLPSASYQTILNLTIGKNLYYEPNMSVLIENVDGLQTAINGYVTSYTPSTGNISINTTYAFGASPASGLNIQPANMQLYSNSSIVLSTTGVTITGITCTGLTSGITNYIVNSGQNNTYFILQKIGSGSYAYGYLRNYNSVSGQFSLYLVFVSGGSGTSWLLTSYIDNGYGGGYTGHYIELDEINASQF